MLARIGLVALAAVVAAWFAVLVRDTHRLHAAAASSGSIAAVESALHGPQAQFQRRIDDLRSARLLNPDTTADLDIAGSYLARGGTANLARALAIADSVTRREPANLNAWFSVFQIQRARHDPAGVAVALAHARRLDPVDFRGG